MTNPMVCATFGVHVERHCTLRTLMSDRKSFTRKGKKSGKQTKGKSRFNLMGRRLPMNELMLQTAWSLGNLTSSTAGTIASTVSPSLSSSFENSAAQTLFTEVRLVSFEIIYSCNQSTSSVVQSNLHLGTNLSMNAVTFSTPTTLGNVLNLTKMKDWSSAEIKPVRYKMLVPRDLLFTSTASGADTPTIPSPFEGSPGTIILYGTGFANSTLYFTGGVARAVFQLRGRN